MIDHSVQPCDNHKDSVQSGLEVSMCFDSLRYNKIHLERMCDSCALSKEFGFYSSYHPNDLKVVDASASAAAAAAADAAAAAVESSDADDDICLTSK